MATLAAQVTSPPLPPRPVNSPSLSSTSTISPSPSSNSNPASVPPLRPSPSSTATTARAPSASPSPSPSPSPASTSVPTSTPTPVPSVASSSVHPAAPHDTFDGFNGWLDKRAERGLQSYQRRFFVVSLSDQSLSYYKQPDSLFPIHFVPLSDILLVQLLADQKKGCRFDVVTSHRVMQLCAESPKAAADWVMALSRCLNTTRERQQEKANNRLTRQPEPRTPTILKPFWQQGLGYATAGLSQPLRSVPAPPATAASVAGVSGLKAAFFQLNFSVSTLNQPDFFHDLLDDFRSDDDILAFLFDALLQPDNNDNAARAILQAREIAARAKEGQAGAASRLQTSNGSKQEEERGDKEGNRSKLLGKAGVPAPTPDGREEELSQISTNGQAEGRVPRTHSRQATVTKRLRVCAPSPARLIRSRSNLCLDVVHLSRSSTTPPPPPRYDTDIGVVTPAGRLRASLPFFARYELFRASANRSRDFAMFDARKKIVSWLHSDAAMRILAEQRLLSQRLALPLLFALLQSRHHDDVDGDEAGMYGKANKSRRSPSYDSDQAGNNSLSNIFKQGNTLTIGSGSQPASPASPAIPLTPSTSAAQSSPSPGSPFRSHLTVSAHPTDSTVLFQDRELASESNGSSGAAGKARLSPYNAPTGAPVPPPRFAGNGRALNYATPTPSPNKPFSPNNSGSRDMASVEFPYPASSHSMPNANRYATVRLPSPHSAASASSANSVVFGARGGAVFRPPLGHQPLLANHWRKEYSSECPQCRATAQQLCELVSTQFRTTGSALTVTHVNALLSTLVTAVEALPSIDNIDSDTHNVFNKPVVNAGVWLTLFTLLDFASNSVKKHALKDITGVLVAANVGGVNCESVLQVPRWQSFVLPLLFPRPLRNVAANTQSAASSSFLHNGAKPTASDATRRHSSAASASAPSSTAAYELSLREKVDQYAQNVMGVLHFHAFVTRSADEFALIFKHSFLLAMRESKGGVRVPRSMLQVTLQRLISKLKAKAIELDERWSSIDYLIAFIKAFVCGLPLNTPQSTPTSVPAAGGYNSQTHPMQNGHNGPSHRESIFQSAASLISSHAHSALSRERPPSPVTSGSIILDFGVLRPPSMWKRGLLEDRDLLERTLQLMRRCRVYQDVDLSTLAAAKQQQVKEQIEHGSNTQSNGAASSLQAPGSAGNSPSPGGSSRKDFHKRQMSTAAGLLSTPLSQSASSVLSSGSSSSSSKADLFHPLNRFKLNAVSEDLAISYLSWSAADRAAFLSVQKEVGWCKDTAVFVSVLSNRARELSDEQVGQLRQAFASGADKREKVFGNVKSITEMRKRRY